MGIHETGTMLNMPEDKPVPNQDVLWECKDHPSAPPLLLSTSQERETPPVRGFRHLHPFYTCLVELEACLSVRHAVWTEQVRVIDEAVTNHHGTVQEDPAIGRPISS